MNASGEGCRSAPDYFTPSEGEAGPGGLARDGGGDDGPGPLVEHVVTEDQNGPFAGLFVAAGRVELGPEHEIAILALLIASQWYCQGSHRRFLPSRLAVGEAVEGAADAAAAGLVEDVGVDHGGLDVAVTQQLLDGADVVPLLEEMGGEGVSEGVPSARPTRSGGGGGRCRCADRGWAIDAAGSAPLGGHVVTPPRRRKRCRLRPYRACRTMSRKPYSVAVQDPRNGRSLR
jgi:hypothetical protein